MPLPPPALPPARRRKPTPAIWSKPARLRTPPPLRGSSRRAAPAREDRKLPILLINFALFFLYVCALFVFGGGADSELRLAVPIGLAVFGLASFAPLVLAMTRREKSKDATRRRSLRS